MPSCVSPHWSPRVLGKGACAPSLTQCARFSLPGFHHLPVSVRHGVVRRALWSPRKGTGVGSGRLCVSRNPVRLGVLVQSVFTCEYGMARTEQLGSSLAMWKLTQFKTSFPQWLSVLVTAPFLTLVYLSAFCKRFKI